MRILALDRSGLAGSISIAASKRLNAPATGTPISLTTNRISLSFSINDRGVASTLADATARPAYRRIDLSMCPLTSGELRKYRQRALPDSYQKLFLAADGR